MKFFVAHILKKSHCKDTHKILFSQYIFNADETSNPHCGDIGDFEDIGEISAA